jgi:flagellar hook-associated protein 3 FlgL
MSATDYSLSEMTEIAKDALSLAQEGVSDTLGADERTALATEMEGLFEQALDVANTTHQGKYLFGGTHITGLLPFAAADTTVPADGKVDVVNYQGDSNVMLRTISQSQTISQNVIAGDTGTPPTTSFSKLFAALISARDALQATVKDVTAIQTAASDISEALDAISQDSTVNGARQRQVQMVGERIETTQIELKSLLSKKEDVNMAEAISYLTQQKTIYQTVLEVGNRAISLTSLFEILG